MSTTTIEDLRKLQDKNTELIKPHREEFERHQAIFKAECKKLEDAFQVKYDEFLDSKLKDKIGTPIKIGDKYFDNKDKWFQVVGRGVQFILGHICDNPRIMGYV